MRKTLGWLIIGLVAGAAIVVWLRPAAPVPEPARNTMLEVGADPVLAREYAELKQRVAALEEQVNRRALELDDLKQRAAANFSGGVPPGGPVPLERESYSVPRNGPRESPLTLESVAAAAAAGQPVNAPMTLIGLDAAAGQVLVFRVTGSTNGTVWGSDIYTDDSSIAAAAVHSGALRPGETGTLMLTLQAGNESYPAVTRNGVNSQRFGPWGRGYMIQRLN